MTESSTTTPPKPKILARIISFILKVLTKGWWVLILILAAVWFYIKRRLNQAKLADGLKTQRDIERKANEEYKTLGYKNRAARAQLNKEILQSRQDWRTKKQEIENALANDSEARTRLWDRAFGARAPVRTDSGER